MSQSRYFQHVISAGSPAPNHLKVYIILVADDTPSAQSDAERNPTGPQSAASRLGLPGRVSRWAKPILRLLIAALVTWGIWRTVSDAREDFQRLDFSLQRLQWQWLLASGIVYLAGLSCSWMFWHRVLRAMGQEPSRGRSLQAYFVGHLGKYVPGKILVVAIRAGLVRGPRVDVSVAAASVFVETLTMMAVGSAVAASYLALSYRHHQHLQLLILAIVLMLLAGIPTLPPIFRKLVKTLKQASWGSALHAAVDGVVGRVMLQGWAWNLLGWLLMGASLWAVLKSLALGTEIPAVADLPLLAACVALAMVAGFLSLIPGGFGVREWVVITLLAGSYGPGAATVSAVILRLVWLVSELGISAILYATRRREPVNASTI